MKRVNMFATIVLMALLAVSAFAAPTGVATLNGNYTFQVSDVKNVTDNKGHTTFYSGVTVGVINFNGKGTAKFLSFVQYQQGGGGGPKINVAYKYAVSGFNGTLTVPGSNGAVISLALGAFNPQGVANTVLLLIPKADENSLEALTGIAILQ